MAVLQINKLVYFVYDNIYDTVLRFCSDMQKRLYYDKLNGGLYYHHSCKWYNTRPKHLFVHNNKIHKLHSALTNINHTRICLQCLISTYKLLHNAVWFSRLVGCGKANNWLTLLKFHTLFRCISYNRRLDTKRKHCATLWVQNHRHKHRFNSPCSVLSITLRDKVLQHIHVLPKTSHFDKNSNSEITLQ